MSYLALLAVSKSQISPGVFRPITRAVPSYAGGGREADPVVRAALGARLRGDPVYHGGTTPRVKKLVRRGRADTSATTGLGQSSGSAKGLVFTTPSRRVAENYGAAGRASERFARSGADSMNHVIRPTSKGSVGEFSMKGQWPKRVIEGYGAQAELLYTPEQLKRGAVRVHGIKPGRTEHVKQQLLMRSRSKRSAEYSDQARRAILRGEKTPKQIAEEKMRRSWGV